jgi:hypothetical protein
MSNVLSEAKKQQVIALGRLGWPLRRIEQETGVRRETAGTYLKAAGIGVRPPGAWGRRAPAKPANGVTTGSDAAKPANTVNTNTNTNTENLPNKVEAKAKPANADGVTTGFGVGLMRHADIRTTMNIYGDADSSDMRNAHEKVVHLAIPRA